MTNVYSIPKYTIRLVRDGSVRQNPQISKPSDITDIIGVMLTGLDRENLLVIMLDATNRVIGVNTVCVGSLNSAVVNMREIFKPAILCNALTIIVAHNHPSGDPTPSLEDVNITKIIVDAGELLDIGLLDHIIFADGDNGPLTVSLKERGLGFC